MNQEAAPLESDPTSSLMVVPGSPTRSWQAQILGWLGLGVLVGFVLLPDSYAQMVAWPWIGIWQLGFLALGIWLVSMLRQFRYPFFLLGYGLDWGVLGLAGVLLLSVLQAPLPQLGAWNLYLALGYGVLLYVLRNWLGKGFLMGERLWLGLVITGGVAAVLGLILWWPQALRKYDSYASSFPVTLDQPSFLWDYLLAGWFPRNAMPLGHHNFLGGYLLLIFPMTVAYGLVHVGWRRWLAGLGGTAVLFDLYTTGSRGTYLGLVALTVVSLGVAIFSSRQRWRLGVVGVLVLLVLLTLMLQNQYVSRLVDLVPNGDLLRLRDPYSAVGQRLYMWQAAWNMLRHRPLLGVGLGNMVRVYNLYRPINAGDMATEVQQLHSTPIQLLGEVGILGGIGVLAFAALTVRLWWHLQRQLTETHQRALLFGVGGSWLAYAVASLTDYQLENIAISSSLVILLSLLLDLADGQNLPGSPTPVPYLQRRLLSLAGLVGVCSAAIFCFSLTAAMTLNHQANQNLKAEQPTAAYGKLELAGDLAPWDPTYDLRLGFLFLHVRDMVPDATHHHEVTETVMRYFGKVLAIAPNDSWFSFNRGIVAQSVDPLEAERDFSHAVQLKPRSPRRYAYYLLARSYRANGRSPDKVVAALALQSLLEPQFLLVDSWQEDPLAEYRDAVLVESFELFDRLLGSLSREDPEYTNVYERAAILRWYFQQPLIDVDEQSLLRPVVRALLASDRDPQRAIAILNQDIAALEERIEAEPLAPSLKAYRDADLLLRAWLDPEEYLSPYLAEHPDLEPTAVERVRRDLTQIRDIRAWLTIASEQAAEKRLRAPLYLAYRNYDVATVGHILSTQDILLQLVPQHLGLFLSYPLSFPALEELVEEIKAECLGLVHPTHNNFQLIP